jgi:heat shock protein HtpX
MQNQMYRRDRGLSFRMFGTLFLLGLLYVVFFVVLISLFRFQLYFALALLGGLAFLQYFTSDKLALKASRAKVVSPEEAPQLHAIVDRLVAQANLPKPKVAIIPSEVPNAFATGRNPKHSAVAVTEGLMSRLSPEEIEGVLAHELSHVRHRDVAIMTVASFFAMLASYITQMALFAGLFGGGDDEDGSPVFLIVLLVSIVTYFLSNLLILALSRYREFAADRGAAYLTGAPEGLNAFFIIPATWKQNAGGLFMTHPPLEKRLAALSEIADEMGRPQAYEPPVAVVG